MTDKTEETDEPDLDDEAYAAYLLARAGLEIRGRDGWTLGESYAAALGVHHFHRGSEPLSRRRLVARVDRACRVDAEEDLGPSPPDPGAQGEADAAWSRLYDFIAQHFPEERGEVGSVVDSAVRLLGELDGARAQARESANAVLAAAVREERQRAARVARSFGYLAKPDEIAAAILRGDVAADPLTPSPPDPGVLPGPWVVLPGMTAARAVQRAGDDHLTTLGTLPNRPQDLIVDDQDPKVARVRALTAEAARWVARVAADS